MRNMTHKEWIAHSIKMKLQCLHKVVQWRKAIPLILTYKCAEIHNGLQSYLFIQVSMGNTTCEFGIN